ncbi:hypothetical protein H7170_03420 [Candidatus Gracilibacteria bacterium]|nr:hypothetical protein [Candidatus Gracilibacteria bacterium]
MTQPILFRSHISGRIRSGGSTTQILQRGSDWSHIRGYGDTDDIRDIVWNKMRPDGLSVRVRETQGDYHIVWYIGSTIYDDFYSGSVRDSRSIIIRKIRASIETSAKFAGYQYSEYLGLEQLIRSQPKNALIFISGIPITQDISRIAYHNDLIYLDITHPWESDPTGDILFSGQVVNTRKYLQEYNNDKISLKKILKKIRASYISISTTDNIIDTINIFFKNRYTHVNSSR